MDKKVALDKVLKTSYTARDIQEKIKNNEMRIFQDFVRRLHLPTEPNPSRETLIRQLSECLITSEGKNKASKILGLKTFEQMYSKSSRRSSSSKQSTTTTAAGSQGT